MHGVILHIRLLLFIQPIKIHAPRKNSSQSSNTKLTNSSYPRNAPRSSRPPRHFTRTFESIYCGGVEGGKMMRAGLELK